MSPAAGQTDTGWRRAERQRLLAERASLSSEAHRDLSRRVIANLDLVFRDIGVATLGIYWPIKREIALLDWAAGLARDRGLDLAMPVVTIPKSPLEYWRWCPGDRMIRGFWNIPVPAERHPVIPDAVIAPLVGFDGRWRLGYGGGYFDRTLASFIPRPIAIGIGFEFSALTHFSSEPHDIPMETIVTDVRIL
jgi:5,10-methenyltetrahydrofolate synthetase